ncbi:MAG: hypothetical protein ACXWYD_18400, partial [Candidatus Binatia bacterium]
MGAALTGTGSGAGFAACATLCGSVSVFFSPEFLSNQAIFWFSPWLGRVSYNIRESHCQNAV